MREYLSPDEISSAVSNTQDHVSKAKAAAAALGLAIDDSNVVQDDKNGPNPSSSKTANDTSSSSGSDDDNNQTDDGEMDVEMTETEGEEDDEPAFFTNIKDLMAVSSSSEDEKEEQEEAPSHILDKTLHSNVKMGLSKDERDDLTVQETDCLFVTARTEDDLSQLEFWCYERIKDEPENGNAFVRWDVMLPNFPVCLVNICLPPPSHLKHEQEEADIGKKRAFRGKNLLAVGTFDPEIEIWDGDVVDASMPVAVLKADCDGDAVHTGAIMSLSYSTSSNSPGSDCSCLLLSSGADGRVAVWDLSPLQKSPSPTNAVKAIATFDHHGEGSKVQGVAWHPTRPYVFASTAIADRRVAIVTFSAAKNTENDILGMEEEQRVVFWEGKLPADPEALAFQTINGPDKLNTDDDSLLAVSCEDGSVHFFCLTMASSNVTIECVGGLPAKKHGKKACAALAWHSRVPGLLATAGHDRTIRCWRVRQKRVIEDGKDASVILKTDLLGEVSVAKKAGKVFGMAWSPDEPMLLVVGGSEGRPVVWDVEGKALGAEFPLDPCPPVANLISSFLHKQEQQ